MNIETITSHKTEATLMILQNVLHLATLYYDNKTTK